MLFKGTAITRGVGAGIVTATGMDTELGRISTLAQRASGVAAPLEKRLDVLGQRHADLPVRRDGKARGREQAALPRA
ncbi:P-type ATPase [Roseovarius salinarum]|uniref:P-type ATPase n=1 Tax=Roseovarius salinarum TaxID=1981892 RepID=UPI000C3413CC|nr:hypothetical protein [Roseovarius salinarum]